MVFPGRHHAGDCRDCRSRLPVDAVITALACSRSNGISIARYIVAAAVSWVAGLSMQTGAPVDLAAPTSALSALPGIGWSEAGAARPSKPAPGWQPLAGRRSTDAVQKGQFTAHWPTQRWPCAPLSLPHSRKRS